MNKLTVKKAAELACISRPTLYKYINEGKISVVKIDKNTFIEASELIRVFPEVKLNNDKDNVNNLQTLTSEVQHKDEIILMLKRQLEDKQKDNEYLKEQLTQSTQNLTHLNNLLENKFPKKRKKILGIF